MIRMRRKNWNGQVKHIVWIELLTCGFNFGFNISFTNVFTFSLLDICYLNGFSITWACFLVSSGPRELGGSVDLLDHCKLRKHLYFFCKRSLPLSLCETQYLRNVVGDTEIRKGEGMELDQLSQNSPYVGHRCVQLRPFGLDLLTDAFQLREATSTDLPLVIIHHLILNVLFYCFGKC